MTPALSAATTRPTRMAFMQTPNGIFNLNGEWTPKSVGANFGIDPDPRAARGLQGPHDGDIRAR